VLKHTRWLPNTDYFFRKNPKTGDAGLVRSGENENLNTEVLIDMQPESYCGFGLATILFRSFTKAV
jgi:hypothetical protein